MVKRLDEEQVKNVAMLARLELSDEEIQKFGAQLSSILGYIEKLNELDTDGVEPLAHSLPIQNVFREDEVGECLDHEKALANAPERDEEFFRVPKILDDNSSA